MLRQAMQEVLSLLLGRAPRLNIAKWPPWGILQEFMSGVLHHITTWEPRREARKPGSIVQTKPGQAGHKHLTGGVEDRLAGRQRPDSILGPSD